MKRWVARIFSFGAAISFVLVMAFAVSDHFVAQAKVRPYDPIRIRSVTHVQTVHGIAVASEIVCNSMDRPVTVFVSLSWQDQLTTTVYANIVAYRSPGCHQVYLRALQGDGHLVVTETPVRPDGVLGVPVTYTAAG